MRIRSAPMEWRAVIAIVGLGGALALDNCSRPSAASATSSSGSPTPEAKPRDGVALALASDGDAATVVAKALATARTDGRHLVVYVGASWCEPCQRFHAAVLRGALDATFPRLTLLEFDADRDGERLRVAGYRSTYIPLFALPASDGTSSGQQIEGGIKGDGAVANLTPRLQELLAR